MKEVKRLVTQSKRRISEVIRQVSAAGEVVAFLSVGADKDKGVGASYQWVLVKQGVGAS